MPDPLQAHYNVTFCRVLGEEVDAEGITVETCQGDELPAEAQLRQVPNEGFHLGVGHASTSGWWWIQMGSVYIECINGHTSTRKPYQDPPRGLY